MDIEWSSFSVKKIINERRAVPECPSSISAGYCLSALDFSVPHATLSILLVDGPAVKFFMEIREHEEIDFVNLMTTVKSTHSAKM